jgi:hypothetical protein
LNLIRQVEKYYYIYNINLPSLTLLKPYTYENQ